MSTATPAIRPEIARGVLAEIVAPSATKPAHIIFTIPNSGYAIHLRCSDTASLQSRVNLRVSGVIRCEARRVDIVGTGGRFVEPLMGRPRRVQGTVLAVNAADNSITLNAGGGAMADALPLPVVVKLTDARQRADQFPVGTTVGMDVLDGATFTLA